MRWISSPALPTRIPAIRRCGGRKRIRPARPALRADFPQSGIRGACPSAVVLPAAAKRERPIRAAAGDLVVYIAPKMACMACSTPSSGWAQEAANSSASAACAENGVRIACVRVTRGAEGNLPGAQAVGREARREPRAIQVFSARLPPHARGTRAAQRRAGFAQQRAALQAEKAQGPLQAIAARGKDRGFILPDNLLNFARCLGGSNGCAHRKSSFGRIADLAPIEKDRGHHAFRISGRPVWQGRRFVK